MGERKDKQIFREFLGKKMMDEFYVSNFKSYSKAIVNNTAWYWNKDRYSEKWNRNENPEKDPQIHGQVIFDKESKSEGEQKMKLMMRLVLEYWMAETVL